MSHQFPSLDTSPEEPYGWVQWKGTNVCVDIHCCGHLMHYDGGFMYYVECPHCHQVYECGGFIKLTKVPFRDETTILLEDE